MKTTDDAVAEDTATLVPSASLALEPRAPRQGGGEHEAALRPVRIMPPGALERASHHGAVVVATMASTSKLIDIVVRPTIATAPITTIKQLTSIVANSWIFAKTSIDLMKVHGVNHKLVDAAATDSAILVRAVVLLLVRRVVKLDGFATLGNMLSLFQFVKVAGALAESQSQHDGKVAAFLNEIAAIPMKVFSTVAVLLSDAIDMRLRESVALAIGDVLAEARTQLALGDRGLKLTTANVRDLFYQAYSPISRSFLRMGLGVPAGVEARRVMLVWRQIV